MGLREEGIARIDDGLIFNRLALLAILAVLMVLLFPAVQGPYSVVNGAATAFRAARSASIAYASIVQGALGITKEPVSFLLLLVTPLGVLKTASPQKRCRNAVQISAVDAPRTVVSKPSFSNSLLVSIVAVQGKARQIKPRKGKKERRGTLVLCARTSPSRS